jgi:selenocysteine-specific elongation factor
LAAAALAHELKSAPDPKVLRHALTGLAGSGELVMQGGILRRPDFDPLRGLPGDERAIAAQIERRFLADGLNPPELDSVKKEAPAMLQVLRLLLDAGTLVRLKTYDRKSGMVLHRDVLTAIEQQLSNKFPYPHTFTVADVRDLLNATRKSVVPLMEHLDSVGATVRDGNVRRLRPR